MKIKFTPSARSMFLDLILRIKQENPSAAKAFKSKSEVSLSRPMEFPESGRRVQEFSELPFREIVVKPYRFFYRVKEDTVWIVGVWHSAQIPKRSLK